MTSDPRPARRVRDKLLLARLHLEWRDCLLSMADLPFCLGNEVLSLHHVHKHPRDDVRANLVMLCGDGTRGCHGAVENADPDARRELVRAIRFYRPDTFAYLADKLSNRPGRPDSIAADEWLRQHASVSRLTPRA